MIVVILKSTIEIQNLFLKLRHVQIFKVIPNPVFCLARNYKKYNNKNILGIKRK